MPTGTISRCGGSAAGATYAATITSIAATSTLVAQWKLGEGATPYADTSGYAPADPATLTITAGAVAMTQNYTPGAFPLGQAQPAVAFNFDGTALTSSGDFLAPGVSSDARWQFAGTLPFTVIAWVKPFAGTNTYEGPVVSALNTFDYGGPSWSYDGWRINIVANTRMCTLERLPSTPRLGTPDLVSLGALSTAAWSMVAMTYDGATLRGYLNGALVGTTASAGTVRSAGRNDGIGSGQSITLDARTWYYGAEMQTSVWAATLTGANIAALYTAGTT